MASQKGTRDYQDGEEVQRRGSENKLQRTFREEALEKINSKRRCIKALSARKPKLERKKLRSESRNERLLIIGLMYGQKLRGRTKRLG